MKKRQIMRINGYIGVLLLAGLAAACQKETEAPAGAEFSTEAIMFTSPYTVARSAEMRDGNFIENDRVGVLGYCPANLVVGGITQNGYAANWNDKKEFATPEVFYNEPLTYQGNGSWTYEYSTGSGTHVGDLCAWYEGDGEEDYKYTFFAYYPYVELPNGSGTIYKEDGRTSMGTIELSGKGVKGDPSITYTMPFEGGNSNTRRDIDVVPDVMLAYNVDHRKADGAVPLEFRHMLCAFEFEINNYTENEVTINALTFRGEDFYRSFTITGQEQEYTPGSGRYSGTFNLLPEGSITVGARVDENTPTTVKLTMDGTADGELIDLLFIPDGEGKITAEGSSVCAVNVSTTAGNESNQNLRDGMVFEPGVRSVFSINIIGNNFILQVRTQERWTDGGDSEINFD